MKPEEQMEPKGREQAVTESVLERLGAQALAEADKAEERLKGGYYMQLAEESLEKGTGGKTDLEQAVEAEVASLQRASQQLGLAFQKTSGLASELSARLRDTRTSRDRKWYLLNPPANAAIDLEEKRQKHFAQGINLYKLFLVCVVGSFAGVVVEMLWCLVRYGYIESRAGLVYGPFNLLYGAGAVLMTLALYRYRNQGYIWSFLGGMVVGSVVEYVCSWGQEMVFGSRSWDYSALPLNLNGRICLLYSVFWGVLGVLWIKDLYPRMAKWILKLPNRFGKCLTWVLVAFMVVNAAVSCVAVWRWSERVAGQSAPSSFWEFVDQRFPDERMERIFANMRFGK